MKPGGESRMPMMACAVTDFPDPDSPRMASVSPSWTSNDTPLMALATPSRVRNSTCSWSTSSSRPSTGIQTPWVSRISTSALLLAPTDTVMSASSAKSRIEGVADDIAQHDEGEHRQRQEEARKQQHVRGYPDQSYTGGL